MLTFFLECVSQPGERLQYGIDGGERLENPTEQDAVVVETSLETETMSMGNVFIRPLQEYSVQRDSANSMVRTSGLAPPIIPGQRVYLSSTTDLSCILL